MFSFAEPPLNSPIAFPNDAWGFKFGDAERGAFTAINGADASATCGLKSRRRSLSADA